MKTISTYFIALATLLNINFICKAQSPTITSAILPQIGYSYYAREDSTAADLATFTVSPGSASAQTWNYVANFVNTYTTVSSFVAPSSGLGNSNFPSATLAFASGGGTTWIYCVGNSAGLALTGYYVTGGLTLSINFTPNLMIFPTPFTYGNTLSNPTIMTYTFNSGGTNYKSVQHSTRLITADAYGTITTPTGTFPNCLRNKTYTTSIDTFYMQVGATWTFVQRGTDSSTNYNWIQNNNTTLSIMSINLDKKLKVTNASYFSSFNNEITSYVRNDESASIFPNPSSDVSYVNYENKLSGHVDVNLLDLNGNLVSTLLNEEQSVGTQQIKVDISSMKLAKGLYFVRINNTEGSHTLKFSVN